jgi:hypothetical protein
MNNERSEQRAVLTLQPYTPQAWGEVFEVFERPQRSFRAEKLSVRNGAEFIIESFRCAHSELFVRGGRWAAMVHLNSFVAPLVHPPNEFRLRVRAVKAVRARPWLRGSRAERKRRRVAWWRTEALREPGVFQASIIGVVLTP